MGCDCSGAVFSCRKPDLLECGRRACEKGYTLNNWWQSVSDAKSCAQRWTEKTGIPHYIAENTYVADDAPVSRTDFALMSCPRDKLYDGWLRPNEASARVCAEKWNDLSKAKGSPLRYEARRIAARLFFADIWKVVERK